MLKMCFETFISFVHQRVGTFTVLYCTMSCPVHFLSVITMVLKVNNHIYIWKHTFYLAPMWIVRTKDHIWKTTQIWLLCEHSAGLCLRLSHMDTDRQTDEGEDEGDHRVLPKWLSRSVVFQPTAAHWRTPSPRRVQTHNQIRRHILQLYLYSSCPWVSLLVYTLVSMPLFTSFGLFIRWSVCLFSFRWWFITFLFYSSCCYSLTNGNSRLRQSWNAICIHSLIKYSPD